MLKGDFGLCTHSSFLLDTPWSCCSCKRTTLDPYARGVWTKEHYESKGRARKYTMTGIEAGGIGFTQGIVVSREGAGREEKRAELDRDRNERRTDRENRNQKIDRKE